jgi:hypothetical protein
MDPVDILPIVTKLRLNTFSWVEIALKIGWHIKTLRRWKDLNNFIEPLSTPPIEIIREIVILYIQERQYRGEVMLMGHLRGFPHFIWIRMTDLREIINSV